MNTFLQSWDPNLHSKNLLPRDLRLMLTVGKKYNVRLDTLKLPVDLKHQLPIWYHIGAEQRLASLTKKPPSQCLRRVHGVSTVGDTVRVTRRLTEIFMDKSGKLRRHLPWKNCACPPCKADRIAGCQDPSKCCATAKDLTNLLFPKYAADWNPPTDGLSLTPNRLRANVEAIAENDVITFNPSITDPTDLSQTIRVFASPRNDMSGKIPTMRPKQMRPPTEEVTVYTDGASLNNGDVDSQVGSGTWFRHDDPRNEEIRVPGSCATNQTGELIAVLAAVRKTCPGATLNVKSDSKYVIRGLTEFLSTWEDIGWIDVKNAIIFQTLASSLRSRSAPTTFQWVKGHSGVEGNEQADGSAGRGALKPEPDKVPLIPNKSYLLNGAKLSCITQALAYRGIRSLKRQHRREATQKNMKLAQETVWSCSGRLRPLTAIWKGIRSKDIDRPVQDFLWKTAHNAHKVGTYWSYIPECEDRILCKHCGEEELMQHIVCKCKAPGQELAWRLARALWLKKSKEVKPLGTAIPRNNLGSWCNRLRTGLSPQERGNRQIVPHTDVRNRLSDLEATMRESN